jgi:hypothetical protein
LILAVWFHFQLEKYILICNVVGMDACGIVLGRPWQYDFGAIHDGRKNSCTFWKDSMKITLAPKKEDNFPKLKQGNGSDFLWATSCLKEAEEIGVYML